jgi:hypothetical protein
MHRLVSFGDCILSLSLQVEPTQLGPIDSYQLQRCLRGQTLALSIWHIAYVLHEYGDRIQSPKRCVLNIR